MITRTSSPRAGGGTGARQQACRFHPRGGLSPFPPRPLRDAPPRWMRSAHPNDVEGPLHHGEAKPSHTPPPGHAYETNNKPHRPPTTAGGNGECGANAVLRPCTSIKHPSRGWPAPAAEADKDCRPPDGGKPQPGKGHTGYSFWPLRTRADYLKKSNSDVGRMRLASCLSASSVC